MQNVKDLIVWAKGRSKSIKRMLPKYTFGLQITIKEAQMNFIDCELLPKLEEILHTSSNTQSTKRKKKVKE